jgi:hypothetical protein
MEDTQKCLVRLSHWIDHNGDHLKGYEEVAAILDAQGLNEAASFVRQGIRAVETANAEFRKAKALISEGAGTSEEVHTHEASGHCHGHGPHCGHSHHEGD